MAEALEKAIYYVRPLRGQKGLVGNLELNAVEDNNGTVNYRRLNINQHPSHRSWFEELWNDSEDWNVCPRSNNWWLRAPRDNKGMWVLSARYASTEDCALIGKVLQAFMK